MSDRIIRGFSVRVSKYLDGQRRPVMIGDSELVVSPAMWDLMANSDGDELDHLLRNLFPIRLPADFTSIGGKYGPRRENPVGGVLDPVRRVRRHEP